MKIDCSKESNFDDLKAIGLGLMFAGNMLVIMHLAEHGKGVLGATLWICGIVYGKYASRRNRTLEKYESQSQ